MPTGCERTISQPSWQKVIRAEQDVQITTIIFFQETEDPHIRSILRDLLLYEEMNN